MEASRTANAKLARGTERCFMFPDFGCASTPDGRLDSDAGHDISQAMGAYVTIAGRVFGAT
eukprot:6813649-Pyramimonas_sp.AAC.1